MKYAVKNEDETFSGTVYDQISDYIINYHGRFNQKIVKVPGIVNNGSKENPDWQTISINDVDVPKIVSMRQARIVLHRHGYLSQVAGAILNLSEPQKTEASIEWEYATTVERDSELVSLLQSSLSITDEEVDQMFREAVLI